jgi:hypothetical protein
MFGQRPNTQATIYARSLTLWELWLRFRMHMGRSGELYRDKMIQELLQYYFRRY